MDRKSGKSETNGSVLSAKELMELHERVLKRVRETAPAFSFSPESFIRSSSMLAPDAVPPIFMFSFP
jgi:hypothetical protein